MFPDRDRMLSWLRKDVITPEGDVLSWKNDEHPGYSYPEAAGLWLGALAASGPPGDLEERVASRLAAGVTASGSVGRRGFEYPFDTAVALRGLLAFERAGGRLDRPETLSRMFEFLVRCAAARSAVLPPIDEDRWSTRWNPHLLKLVIVCSEWQEKTSDSRASELSLVLQAELLPKALAWLDDEIPHYSHAVCYATEAMLHLARSKTPRSEEGTAKAAAWLAHIQDANGGIPAWSRPGPETRLASDATAQAIGIWTAVDRSRYAKEVERAFAHLARMQHPSGGIRYSEQGSDVNSWCTIFALDALRAAGR